MFSNISKKTFFLLPALFLSSYVIGAGAGSLTSAAAEGNWGLSFHEENTPPTANASTDELAQYDAYYMQDTDEKILYLTFDAGYENGNTEKILDVLKKHDVSAAFFVVGTYIESNPELVKRMCKDGHIVGNHTWHHPDMSQMSTLEPFLSFLCCIFLAEDDRNEPYLFRWFLYIFSLHPLILFEMIQDLGYKTFFWSLAYVDWYDTDQPTKAEAFDKLLKRIHPGAIVLLHSTSKTNTDILDELLTKWKEMGYQIKPLTQLP